MKTNNENLILVTNDDGIHAKGIKALIDIVKDFGRVVVVAPEVGQSGMSHAITMTSILRVNLLDEYDNVSLYSCNGTPVDCVKVARSRILARQPDFIVSGINHGANSSVNVLYSGTMGATFEGCINGIPCAGFSLLDHDPKADFNVAKKYVRTIFAHMVKEGLPNGTGLNVNIPVASEDEIQGIKICHQTNGVWNEEYEKRTDPHGGTYYWLTGVYENFEPEDKWADEWALQNNYVAVVPVQVDMTDYNAMKKLKHWNHEKRTPKKV